MAGIGVISFVIGVVYGYLKPGKEERKEILKKGAKIGIGLGIIFAILGVFVFKDTGLLMKWLLETS